MAFDCSGSRAKVSRAGRSGPCPDARSAAVSASWSSRCARKMGVASTAIGRVHEDRELRDGAARLERAEREEHLLRPPDGEGGDDERAPLRDRADHLGAERVLRGASRVELPAVGALEHERVGGDAGLGIGEDGRAVPAEVAAEEEPARPRPDASSSSTSALPRMWPARWKRIATPGRDLAPHPVRDGRERAAGRRARPASV